jgi:hypothetical protein
VKKWASSSPVSAGVGLVVAGFIALFLAWNGAAGKDYVEGQLPYMISGGLVGIALVGAGLTVVNVQARRADQVELLNKLEVLLELRADEQAPTAPARGRQLSAAKPRRKSA